MKSRDDLIQLLKDEPLVKDASQKTGLTLEQLMNFDVEPFEYDGFITWAFSPGIDSSCKNYLDAKEALLLIWFYLNQSGDPKARQDASTRITIAELGLTYTSTRKGQSEGGKKAAQAKREGNLERNREIYKAYCALTGDERYRAGTLAERWGLTPKTIRKIIKEQKETNPHKAQFPIPL